MWRKNRIVMSYVMDLTISSIIMKCFLQFSNSLIYWVMAVWLHIFLLRLAQYLPFFILFVFLVCVCSWQWQNVYDMCADPTSMMLFSDLLSALLDCDSLSLSVSLSLSLELTDSGGYLFSKAYVSSHACFYKAWIKLACNYS